ncbi:hypothetical protein K435DRAFT_799869 [Dendrothele bispora CBS 962.96]|uniref:Uncharacterized protein n=1 Tax=Dendrothele bispora (strain CBS 962.96) TaxID=1314807 RepID=A0A4S8LUG6_DENBC|nr:hypothetical protein K435DRAFT_799869 [Dendrothele bispora CBS 962.96]
MEHILLKLTKYIWRYQQKILAVLIKIESKSGNRRTWNGGASSGSGCKTDCCTRCNSSFQVKSKEWVEWKAEKLLEQSSQAKGTKADQVALLSLRNRQRAETTVEEGAVGQAVLYRYYLIAALSGLLEYIVKAKALLVVTADIAIGYDSDHHDGQDYTELPSGAEGGTDLRLYSSSAATKPPHTTNPTTSLS